MFEQLAETSLSIFLRKSEYSYPILNALHVTGIAILFGSILIFDLSLLGRTKNIPAERIHELTVPITKIGCAIVFLTGLSMFIGNPLEYVGNRSFQLKLLVIALALINVGIYQKSRASFHGLISMVLWTSVIFLGRWIAYA